MANEHSLMSESRSLGFVYLTTNVRSLINIANGLEFNRYDDEALRSIDRFDYLSS